MIKILKLEGIIIFIKQSIDHDNQYSKNNNNKKSYLEIDKFTEESRSVSANSGMSGSRENNMNTKSIYSSNNNAFANQRLSNDTLVDLSSKNNLLKITDQSRGIIKETDISLGKQESSTQTDLYELFQFFMDFFKRVELMLKSGQLQKLLIMNGLVKEDDVLFKQQLMESVDRLQKLQKYMGKITSLANKGGDLFFRSVFSVFQAHPHVFNQEQIDRYVRDNPKKKIKQKCYIIK